MKANESITSAIADAYGSIQTYRNRNKDPRIDPNVIKQVALTGFNDFNRKLLAAGINLRDPNVVKNPSVQEKIKDSVVRYVQQYMTLREAEKATKLILAAYNDQSNKSKIKLPNMFDQNTLFKYFEDAARIRAEILVALDAELSSDTSNIQRMNKISDMRTLMAAIPSNHQLSPFEVGQTLSGRKVIALIQSNGAYISNLPAEYEQYLKDNRLKYPVPEVIQYKNIKVKAYRVNSEKNLNSMFNTWISINGGKVPSPLPLEEIVGQLE